MSPHIVALGSSFAAGPGIEPIIDRAAWRSGNNYAHLLATRLQAKLTDLSRSGATLSHILDESQQNMLSLATTPPQLDALPADADIVTITAGGNDMNYIGGMVRDAVRATVHAVPLLGELFPPSADNAEEVFDEEEVTKRFVKIIDRIKTVAPQATVYLVEYQTILGPGVVEGPQNPLNQEQISHHRSVGQSLQKAYEAVARARPEARLIHVGEASTSHGVGSAEPWMVGFTASMLLQGQAPYHPNAAGHRAVADLLYEEITKDQASKWPSQGEAAG